MNKQAFLAALLAAFIPALAHADCTAPDTSPTVVFGSYDTEVANHAIDGICTIEDLIKDEQPWSSQQAFLAHASKVSFNLFKQRKITAVERNKIMAGALQSGVGTTLKVKLICFNDFHGNIKSGEGSSSNPGVARFATKIKELRAANELHAVVSAGDLIGASPLTSALFKDEPTIEAMNRIGIDFNAIGNHEFDEGKTELLRMQNGGNHPTDPYTGKGLPADLKAGEFRGADFKFLAANVVDSATNTTLFPGVGIKAFWASRSPSSA